MSAIEQAEARAARNGLTLETGDVDLGSSWPGKRMAAVHLMRGSEQVAAFAMSYGDDAGRERALRFCAERVFNRPVGVD
jgi:hypothetical protein